jgi:hypothetical protein
MSGQFKVLQTITGKDLKKVAEDPNIVKGNKIFKLYTFTEGKYNI